MAKRILSWVLALVMVCSMLPVNAMATLADAGLDKPIVQSESATVINPLYADTVTLEDLVQPSGEETVDPNDVSEDEYATTYEEAAAQLREGLKLRQESIEVYYRTENYDFDTDYPAIWEESLTHTGVPTEGDYLKWVWAGYKAGASGYSSGNVYYLTFTYTVTYHSTAEQEAELDEAVETLLSDLNPTGTDYQKLKTVYDYICANITYDNDSEDTLKYTAYAALVNKTAVCQGYATLLYRLALEMGIDIRLISGTGNGGDHGWNIVELNDVYYNVDSTWDATWMQQVGYYNYFLQCEDTFTEGGTDHIRSEEYDTAEFHAAYPMSETDFDPNEVPEATEPEETEPEATEPEATEPEVTEPESDVLAEGTCGENLTWVLTNDGMLTISGTGSMTEYSASTPIPWADYADQIKTVVIGENVTALAKYAFSNCTAIEEIQYNAISMTNYANGNYIFRNAGSATEGIQVIIGEKVTRIPNYLFCPYSYGSESPNIKSVTFAEGSVCTGIGSYAFARCTALQDLELPESLTGISDHAFYYCNGLTEVTIPESVTTIGNDAFYQCTGLTGVYISNLDAWCAISFGAPGSNPLYHAANLYLNGELVTEVEFPAGTTAINQVVFYNCTNLTKAVLPDGVAVIGADAFMNCVNLQSINLPDSITEICAEAFGNCSSLTEIVLPQNLTAIYPYAFALCTGLTDIEIPDAVQAIGTGAFGGCTGLKEIAIPAATTYIEPAAIIMSGVETLTVDAGNPVYYAEDSVLFRHDDGTFYGECDVIFYYPPQKAGESYTIPDGITVIADYAFAYNTAITDVTVPASITQVSYGAFGECSNLTKLIFLGDVPTFGDDIFYNVPHVTICYPEGNETWLEFIAGLETSADGNVSFEGVDTSGGSGEGGSGEGGSGEGGSGEGGSGEGGSGEGGSGETEETTTSGTCGQNVAWNLEENGKLTVSVQTAEESQTVDAAANSTYFGDRSDSGFSFVSGFGFGSSEICTAEESSDLVYSASEYAMEDYASADETPWYALRDQITSVEILDGVTHVGSYAFAGCENLSYVSIGNNVSSIGTHAFADCSLNLIFTGDAPEISENAFSGATVNIRIPEGNETWTDEVKQQYGGNVTWVSILYSGVCGDNATWTLDSAGLMVVTGTGEMYSYTSSGSMSWGNYLDDIKELRIEEGITVVGTLSFCYASNLEKVTLPTTLTTIKGSAFKECSSLKEIILHEGITAVGYWCFEGCTSLTSVTIPASLTTDEIGNATFAGCTALQEILVAEDNSKYASIDGMLVNKEGTVLLAAPGGRKNVQIPDGIVTIGAQAFNYAAVEEVTIPDSVTSIEIQAFLECSALKSISIPASVTSIGNNVFVDCVSLSGIYVDANNPVYASADGVLYSKDMTTLISAYAQIQGECIIPSGVIIISNNAFKNAKNLTSVVLPETLTEIGSSAFSNCPGLTEIVFPDSLVTISSDAFFKCLGLTSITFPEGIELIDGYAFSYCINLKEIYFQGDAPEFGTAVFCYLEDATAYYPANNDTWTTVITQDHGGTITWVPYDVDALVITSQPVDFVGLVGDTATFTVVAEGEDLTYQWYYSKDNGETWLKASCTESTYAVEFVAYRLNYQYRCEITDANGNTVVSDPATMRAEEVELAITSQPVSYVGAVNDEVSFVVEATGNGLVYEWVFSTDGGETWAKSYSPGYQTNTLAPILRAHRDGNMYKCVVTDVFDNYVESDAVSMSVKSSDVVITAQPTDVENAVLGQLYTFTVEATGDNLTYRWEVSSDGGETWSESWNQGYNTATLSVRMNANRDGNQYRCVITSGQKIVMTSDAAILDLQDPSVEIISQSGNVTVLTGATATFAVEAEGMDLTYLWYRSNDKGATWNQTYLTGYNTNTLSFDANTNRAAMYMCKVTDGSGTSVWSEPVKLQILSAELKILSQPVSMTCAAGETAVFTVEAQGDTLAYQWYVSSDNGETWTMSYLTGYNTNELSFAVNAARAAKLYKCIITDVAGNTVETDAVSVTIG